MDGANTRIVKRWFEEVWNQRKRATISELFAASGVAHGVSDTGGDLHGPAEFLPFYDRLVAAFPDIRVVVDDCIEAGDKVAVRYSATMSHGGEYFGLQASGRSATVTGISLLRVANGQLVESWDAWDKLTLMHQIGGIRFAPEITQVK
ncbi:MAG TPA: ester cyclase [Candidatus Acidoferrales bacterium]|nr:ester cyclase [Candidatus Acidoferrales bacterium]